MENRPRPLAASDRSPTEKRAKTVRKRLPILLLYAAVVLLTVGVMLFRLTRGEWKEVCIGAAALLSLCVPTAVEKLCHVRLPAPLEAIAVLFIATSLVLGELFHFYLLFPFWDNILHFTSGFMFAAFGYCLVDVFSRKGHARALVSPAFLTFVAVCFSMAVSVCWEFFEFAVDNICQMDMQKDTLLSGFFSTFFENGNGPLDFSGITKTVLTFADGREVTIEGGYLDIGLVDTVSDMILHFLGSAVFAVIGALDAKAHGRGKLGRLFIPVLKDVGDACGAEAGGEQTSSEPVGTSSR